MQKNSIFAGAIAAALALASSAPTLAEQPSDIELQDWSSLPKSERRQVLSALVSGYFENLSRDPRIKHALVSSCLADITIKSLDRDLRREAEVDPEEPLVTALIERLDCSKAGGDGS